MSAWTTPGRALRRYGSGVRLSHCPVPSLLDGACLVSPLLVGLCGTDFQILNGARPDTANVLGHEGAVRMEYAPGWARDRFGIEPGRRYVVNPVNARTGRIIGHDLDGLLQTWLPISAGDLEEQMLVPWPEDLPAHLAPLAEPLAAAIYAVDLAGQDRSLGTCLIVGAGPMGLVLMTYLRLLGGCATTLADRRSEALAFAVDRGLAAVGETYGLYDSAVFVPEADSAFFCGSRHDGASGLEAAIGALRSGGRLDLVAAPVELASNPGFQSVGERIRGVNLCGLPSPGAWTTYGTPTGKPIQVTGHRGTSVTQLERAIGWLAARSDVFAPILGAVLSMSEAAEVMTRACNGERWGPGKLIVVVDPSEAAA